jgi:hypothetical protein
MRLDALVRDISHRIQGMWAHLCQGALHADSKKAQEICAIWASSSNPAAFPTSNHTLKSGKVVTSQTSTMLVRSLDATSSLDRLTVSEQLIISSEVIHRMTNKASFDVDMFKLYQLRTSLVNISLCLTEPRRYSDDSFPISGFPRLLTLDDTPLCECCYIQRDLTN